MLQMEPQAHSAILLTFIKLPFVISIFALSIFEWPFSSGFAAFIVQGFHGSEIVDKYRQILIEILTHHAYRVNRKKRDTSNNNSQF